MAMAIQSKPTRKKGSTYMNVYFTGASHTEWKVIFQQKNDQDVCIMTSFFTDRNSSIIDYLRKQRKGRKNAKRKKRRTQTKA